MPYNWQKPSEHNPEVKDWKPANPNDLSYAPMIAGTTTPTPEDREVQSAIELTRHEKEKE